MRVRPALTRDWANIKALHEKAGYGFALPEDLKGVQVAELGGIMVAAAGYELAAQIVAVTNQNESPLMRVAALKALHAPLAAEVLDMGAKSVYSFCDPRFKTFSRRMMRMGWNRKLWPCLFLDRAEIEKVFG